MTKLLGDITILIADDVPLNLMILKQVLTNAGAIVLTAANGREVLEIFEMETSIDILLIDLQMPELDGYETAQVIRYCGQTYSDVPIVAVTGETGVDEIYKCTLAGMNDFISKPFQADVICQKVLALLRKETTQPRQEINQQEMDRKPSYDLGYLKETMNGEIEKMMMIVDNLVENAPLLLSQTRTAIKNENWDQTTAHAHKLKGLIGLFFMPKITAALIAVEEGSKATQPDKICIEKEIDNVAMQLPEVIDSIINDIKIGVF